jgi:hypothetical protein
MDYALMFILSFLVECAGAGYTVAIARNRIILAIVFSALNSVLAWVMVLFIVCNVQLMPAAIIGDVLGTSIMLKISLRRL